MIDILGSLAENGSCASTQKPVQSRLPDHYQLIYISTVTLNSQLSHILFPQLTIHLRSSSSVFFSTDLNVKDVSGRLTLFSIYYKRFESSKRLKRLSIAQSRSDVNVTHYNSVKLSSIHVPFAVVRGSEDVYRVHPGPYERWTVTN
jgi:hypothetical protein